MALNALNWLSSNLGIDITGENSAEGGTNDVFGKIGSAVFGDKAEDDGLPATGDWGYEFNKETGQWEPSGNAPQHIHAEQQERLNELHAPPPVVAPPPTMDNANFNFSRDLKAPKYADHFNSYSGSSYGGAPLSSPGATSPTATSPAYSQPQATPSFQQGEIGAPPPPPQPFSGQAPAVPQQTANCINAAPPQAVQQPVAATEQPVANMVHFSAPPLPAQGSMLSAQMPDSLIQ
jgi:hypothetical protein|mmetsp:Transcript_28057/g.47619  ORF Transcript_28057/g.47619 Transcript_28057/m.47619 type:complete len:234 (-) Transcript_28057:1177-1878(-)|eukprot:CAMPEP_0174293652 /NCGR_PEP_ID=MMETSP0809-20121228/39264_1 /TAXON_ID=73025 ORGANISM="Eutreptiella gymnastica-like, Strain CCMP1594" /NCGR_SAMPLE_ID=MMETSP0809 /ASSEMBLY_ACC=CAM_ASM_000658 /LENGTH=233 /DNA_ID=CAMNT_0015394593 /DNA_START=36 /DNA_END=737 /DNA_ORIENTATION=+